MTDGVLELADGLYALPLERFTPERDALAKEHKADKALAASLKALRKPSVAAWVVNLFVRREPAQVDQVIAVGAALRGAQEGMDGAELRALTRQRRQLTSAVTTQARGLAADEGVKVTQAVADQVEATLTAAMLDAECARAVRSGLLVGALRSTGVDEVDVAGAVAVPGALGFSARPTTAAPIPRADLHLVPDDPDEKKRAAAEAALEAAEAAVSEAGVEVSAANDAAGELQARSLQIKSEIDELRRALADLETRAEETDDELSEAEDTCAEAEASYAAAVKARDAARAALDG